MKKILFLLFAFIAISASMNAQIVRTDDLEKYTKEKYGKNWFDAATNLGSKLTLDKNHALTCVQVIPADGKTKDQLYVILNYWFASTFNDANSVIKLNDKELGIIIAKGYVANIAQHLGGTSAYNVNIEPVIKCDIKDGKVRVTYTIPFYTVNRIIGRGWLSILGGSPSNTTSSNEKWVLDKCYPFIKEEDEDPHEKTSCKALVMAYAYSNVVMDKIEECVKNGLSGNKNEDW